MSRVPIRIRLTLVFTLALAIMLAATGAFVYQRHRTDLNAAIDQGLRARAAELADRMRTDMSAGPLRTTRLEEHDESLTAVLGADGRIVDATPNVPRAALLSPAEVAAASRTPTIEQINVPGFDAPVRVLAGRFDGGSQIGVVGVALADRNEALAALRKALLIAAPFGLLAAALATYGLAALALRPVEMMRRRAAEISTASGGERLPVPATRDELARLGTTLNAMIERMQLAVARERRFAADASHELRTPLALLRTEIDLALDGDRPREELVDALRSAGEETDRLTRLAEDLLLLARADENQLILETRPVVVDDLFHEVAGRFGAAADTEGRPVRWICPDGLVIGVDRAAVGRALANLLANALEHGSGPIDLVATADPLELHVIDRGGTLSDTAPLFERFRRGGVKTGGSGLGLAIVAAIAEAHGGAAGAVATTGRFDAWIRLPASARGADISAAPSPDTERIVDPI
jgi:signal transduction histidine kinase